jgi:phosphoribosylformylglycinamidine synthase II
MDPPITPALVKQHKLTESEYRSVLDSLGREPTYAELGVFSVMWSEHCSYKSSRVHLRRLPTQGPRVIQGPGENAGVVDIGDGFAAVFKMESHNHPSFIEPYQGAATGVGGILRDVFTMGARPIASLNSLRFGRPDHPRTPELLRGVVAGIGGYGNCIGVPTVGGELQFDERYDGNILVNAFTCGVARADRIFYGRATGVGNSILYIGAKTGRDGIHGATMASDEFTGSGPGAGTAKRPTMRSTMQVGDPFMGKLLLEACLELFSEDILEGIQDMGAAGLTSSSVEMAGRADNGIEIDLDRVPRRAKAMTPYEILLSESQERMLLVAKPEQAARVLEICARWELDAAVIGKVTDTKRWVVKATPGYDPLDPRARSGNREAIVVCDIPTAVLTEGAPCYDRPRSAARPIAGEAQAGPVPADLGAALLDLLGSPNIGSRAWVWRQYDQIVRGGTVVRPGSDAAVVRVPCEVPGTNGGKTVDKFLAFAVDCNARMCEIDPFVGGAMAIAEVCRNLVCTGAEPIGITDCLNFGNPERPEVMESFARAIDGLAAACRALDVPIVSGNVSLYNETSSPDGAGGSPTAKAILPTPAVAAVGLVREQGDIVTAAFKGAGDVVILLGEADGAGLEGSEWQARTAGRLSGQPRLDLDAEVRLQRLVLELARSRVLQSAHDVSDGGLGVALAECCTVSPEPAGRVGARIELPAEPSAAIAVGALFGEAPSRVVVSVPPLYAERVLDRAKDAGVPARRLGQTGGDSLSLTIDPLGSLIVATSELAARREACLVGIVGSTD